MFQRALRWAGAWALYWIGDLVSRWNNDDRRFTEPGFALYQWCMMRSVDLQGGGAGPWVDNPQPTYWTLLGNAQIAGEMVDMFDVRSEDPQSLAEFERLQDESDAAQLALLRYVASRRSVLEAGFGARPS